MGSVSIAGVTVWNQAVTSRRVDATERRIEAIDQANVKRNESLKREVKEEIQTMKKTVVKALALPPS
jgi:hypothetical protein